MNSQDVISSKKKDRLKNGPLKLDPFRDHLLTEFGKRTMKSQYLQEGDTFQDLFERVASTYGDDAAHSQRLYDYISSHWLMGATPVLGNAGLGTSFALPISCYVNEMQNSLSGITGLLSENMFLSAGGGGIGSFLGNIPQETKTKERKYSAGIIPLSKVIESSTLAISQGLRRGASAVYLPISHPEIEDFIDIRKPAGGDPQRRAIHIHHGVTVTDAFMRAVENNEEWNLVDPSTQAIVSKVAARDLWVRLLTARVETGEPYIIFMDSVNNSLPAYQKDLGLSIKLSNLCTEIFLPTGIDQHQAERTAVCCLSSVNLVHFFEWEKHPLFLEDVFRFLDNVLTDFIERAPEGFEKATYSSQRSRAVGLGVMGWHSFLQKNRVSMDSAMAKVWNTRIFEHIDSKAKAASAKLAQERGPCLDAQQAGVQERFCYKTAVAPTASISIICGGVSPGIEPVVSNAYTHKTLNGSFMIKNPELILFLEEKKLNTPEIWASILENGGSVQHLIELSENEKNVFKTAYEINQVALIDLAADRQPFIDQGQSLNLFFHANVSKKILHQIHTMAWKRGVKSMYYLRSMSLKRAEGVMASPIGPSSVVFQEGDEKTLPLNYAVCLSCQ